MGNIVDEGIHVSDEVQIEGLVSKRVLWMIGAIEEIPVSLPIIETMTVYIPF